MSNLISRQDTDLQNPQAVPGLARIIPPAGCSGGADCFHCACPETD